MKNENQLINILSYILENYSDGEMTVSTANKLSNICNHIFQIYHALKNMHTYTELTHCKNTKDKSVYEFIFSIYDNENNEILRFILHKINIDDKKFKLNILKQYKS